MTCLPQSVRWTEVAGQSLSDTLHDDDGSPRQRALVKFLVRSWYLVNCESLDVSTEFAFLG